MSRPGPQRHVQVGHRAGAGEPRVDVDHRRAAGLGLHHPLEPDRVTLGHVRALDQDAVGVLQVLLERGRAAAAEARPRPGTVEECHIRAWFSIWITPSAVNSFLIR